MPSQLSNDERETLEVQWQQRLAGAAQQAMQAGKMGGSMARLIDHLLQPRLPWRMLLARYMTAMARDDFSYMRPSRREGDAILPSLKSSQIEIVVAIDTSGSIRENEMDEFLSEVSGRLFMTDRGWFINSTIPFSNDLKWIDEIVNIC